MRDVLAALGFEARPVTATTLTTVLTPDVDVLFVGATLNVATLNAANRAALNAFLARRGGVVGLGTAGCGLQQRRVPADRHRDRGAEPRQRRGERRQPRRPGRQRRAVRTPGSSRPCGTRTWAPTRWSSSPTPPIRSCRAGGGGTATNNQAAAAVKASIVRAVGPGGSGLVLIGTSPTVRLHAKGMQPQLGRAVLWAASQTTATTGVDGSAGAPCPRRWH